MKKYVKKKSVKAGPNASGPKYRTPDRISPHSRFGKAGSSQAQSGGVTKESKFGGKGVKSPNPKFKPPFKIQHKV